VSSRNPDQYASEAHLSSDGRPGLCASIDRVAGAEERDTEDGGSGSHDHHGLLGFGRLKNSPSSGGGAAGGRGATEGVALGVAVTCGCAVAALGADASPYGSSPLLPRAPLGARRGPVDAGALLGERAGVGPAELVALSGGAVSCADALGAAVAPAVPLPIAPAAFAPARASAIFRSVLHADITTAIAAGSATAATTAAITHGGVRFVARLAAPFSGAAFGTS